MRTTTNTCDWCGANGTTLKLHRIEAKEACAGSSDRVGFLMEMCNVCGEALRTRNGEVMSERCVKAHA